MFVALIKCNKLRCIGFQSEPHKKKKQTTKRSKVKSVWCFLVTFCLMFIHLNGNKNKSRVNGNNKNTRHLNWIPFLFRLPLDSIKQLNIEQLL